MHEERSLASQAAFPQTKVAREVTQSVIRRLLCNCTSFSAMALVHANEQYYAALSIAQHRAMVMHGTERCTACA